VRTAWQGQCGYVIRLWAASRRIGMWGRGGGRNKIDYRKICQISKNVKNNGSLFFTVRKKELQI
jgi:hypothetical protein